MAAGATVTCVGESMCTVGQLGGGGVKIETPATMHDDDAADLLRVGGMSEGGRCDIKPVVETQEIAQ